MPPSVKPATLSVKSPAPSTSVTAATIRLRFSAEVDAVVDPDLRARRRDEPEHDDRDAAEHGRGDRLDQCAELRREAEHDRDQRRDDEHDRRVDLRDRHHADVLGVGGDAGAADAARDHRGDAVADEGATHHRVEVPAGHRAHGLEVTEVLGDEDHGDRSDQRNRVAVEHRRGEARSADPAAPRRCPRVDRLAQAHAVREEP